METNTIYMMIVWTKGGLGRGTAGVWGFILFILSSSTAPFHGTSFVLHDKHNAYFWAPYHRLQGIVFLGTQATALISIS